MSAFRQIDVVVDKSCQLTFRRSVPNIDIVLKTGKSFHAAGYAVLTENDPNPKFASTRKTHAPVACASKTFTPSQIKKFLYAMEISAKILVIKQNGHIF